MQTTTPSTPDQDSIPILALSQLAGRFQLMGIGSQGWVIDLAVLNALGPHPDAIVFSGPYDEAEAQVMLRNQEEEKVAQEATERLERALQGAASAMRETFDRLRLEGGPR